MAFSLFYLMDYSINYSINFDLLSIILNILKMRKLKRCAILVFSFTLRKHSKLYTKQTIL